MPCLEWVGYRHLTRTDVRRQNVLADVGPCQGEWSVESRHQLTNGHHVPPHIEFRGRLPQALRRDFQVKPHQSGFMSCKFHRLDLAATRYGGDAACKVKNTFLEFAPVEAWRQRPPAVGAMAWGPWGPKFSGQWHFLKNHGYESLDWFKLQVIPKYYCCLLHLVSSCYIFLDLVSSCFILSQLCYILLHLVTSFFTIFYRQYLYTAPRCIHTPSSTSNLRR